MLQNDIPMFSPALTDGAIGDVLYLFSVENPGLIVDITEGTFLKFVSVPSTGPMKRVWFQMSRG